MRLRQEYDAEIKQRREWSTNFRQNFSTMFLTGTTLTGMAHFALQGQSVLDAGHGPLVFLGSTLLIDIMTNNDRSYLMPNRVPASNVRFAAGAAIAAGGLALANKWSPYKALMAASLVGIGIPYAISPTKLLAGYLQKKLKAARAW